MNQKYSMSVTSQKFKYLVKLTGLNKNILKEQEKNVVYLPN